MDGGRDPRCSSNLFVLQLLFDASSILSTKRDVRNV